MRVKKWKSWNAGLAGAATTTSPATLRPGHAPRPREHVDLTLMMGVRRLALDAVDLQEPLLCHVAAHCPSARRAQPLA